MLLHALDAMSGRRSAVLSMVKMLLDAITEALHTEFGSNYKIYTEDVPQGLTPPCFLVTAVPVPTRQKETHVTYRISQLFAIQYFPANENYRSEINGVLDRLDECLEIINVEWATKKTKKTLTECVDTAIADGVLTYTLAVRDVYFRLTTGDMMSNLQSTGIEVNYGEG